MATSVRVIAVGTLLAATALAGSSEYTTLKYEGEKHFQASLHDATLLGELHALGKEPYLVFSGRSCVECDENIGVYIHSPSDGPMKGGGLDARSAYPANYFAYDTGKLVSRVRMFIGRCRNAEQNEVVWFIDEKVEDGGWQHKVFVAAVRDGALSDSEVTKPYPTIQAMRSAAAKNQCREIATIAKVYTEP